MVSVMSWNSATGTRSSPRNGVSLSWVCASKVRIVSSASPKKSSRTGMSMPGGKRSRMPPRTAYSPGSRTVEARVKPLSSSHSITPAIPSTLPGATESACVATKSRAGTRCNAAFTVVSSTDGLSRPVDARQARQRRSCAAPPRRRCGETRSYGRQSQAGNSRMSNVRTEERQRARQGRHALAVAADDAERNSPARLARAAIVRARSASTRPSAPSATCASVSAFPACSKSAGDFAIACHFPR